MFVTRLAHRQEHPNMDPGLTLLTHSSLIPDGQPSPQRAQFLHTPCSSGSACFPTLHPGRKPGQDTASHLLCMQTHSIVLQAGLEVFLKHRWKIKRWQNRKTVWWWRLGAKWKFLYLLPQAKHPRAVSYFAKLLFTLLNYSLLCKITQVSSSGQGWLE